MDDDRDPALDAAYDATLASLQAAGLPEDTPDGDYSDDALALAWGAGIIGSAQYVDAWSAWLFWAGDHWRRDRVRLVWTLIREFVRPLACGVGGKLGTDLRAAKKVLAVATLARSNRELAATVEQWDADPLAVGEPSSTGGTS